MVACRFTRWATVPVNLVWRPGSQVFFCVSGSFLQAGLNLEVLGRVLAGMGEISLAETGLGGEVALYNSQKRTAEDRDQC